MWSGGSIELAMGTPDNDVVHGESSKNAFVLAGAGDDAISFLGYIKKEENSKKK